MRSDVMPGAARAVGGSLGARSLQVRYRRKLKSGFDPVGEGLPQTPRLKVVVHLTGAGAPGVVQAACEKIG